MSDSTESLAVGNLHVQVGYYQGQIVLVLNGSTDVLKPFHENPPVAWCNLGCTLGQGFEQTRRIELLDGAVGAHNLAVKLAPEDHFDESKYLNLFSISLGLRFEATRHMDDLNAALDAGRKALELATRLDPSDAIVLSGFWDTFCTFLQWRFEWIQEIEDLNSAIHAGQQAINLIPRDHQNRGLYCDKLAVALKQRGRYRWSVADLSSAVKASQEAVGSITTDHPRRLQYLCNLVEALDLRSQCSESISDLNEAVEALKEASTLVSSHEYRTRYLNIFALVHLRRYDMMGCLDDLNDAEQASEEAIELSAPALIKAYCLSISSRIYQLKYLRTGLREHLDMAVQRSYESLASTPANHPEISLRLCHLSRSLLMRFEGSHMEEDLANAIKFGDEAVRVTPSNHADQVFCLVNLSATLRARFDWMKSMDDLMKAIELAEQALNSIPVNHPFNHKCWNCLGAALSVRYDATRALSDLNTAIFAYEMALKSNTYECADYLNGLGVARWQLFERTESLDDLDAAVEAYEKAVNLTRLDDIDRAARLTNLGVALHKRFDRTKSAEDLDKAIRVNRKAVNSISKKRSDQATCLHNLGNALQARFHLLDSLDDLDAAVEANQLSVNMTPENDPQRASHLDSLGTAFWRRSERMKTFADVNAASKAFEEVVHLHTASPSIRILSAVHAASLYSSVGRAESAMEMMSISVELLPKTSTRVIGRDDRQYILSCYFRLAADACALSVRCGNSVFQALCLLELGRGVMASTHFETRSDVRQLQRRHPELAERYISLCEELNLPADKYYLQVDSILAKHSLSSPAARHYQVSNALDDVIALIQEQDGFSRFLLGPTAEDLKSLASSGPIVFLNSSPFGSDAFLVTPSKMERVSLTNLTYGDLESNADKLIRLSRDDSDLIQHNVLPRILKWLWDNLAEPVLQRLGFTEAPKSDHEWPHVWWIPVGLLSLFPIHAAGYHGKSDSRTVLDRVISSYAPTAKSLDQARSQVRSHLERNISPQSVLLVSMPDTPHRPSLGNTLHEIDAVVNILPQSIERISLTNPTTSELMQNIEECSIVHLACHGEVDPDPSKSQILLADWEINPCTVSSLAQKNLGKAAFAYVSACHAANSRSINLLDESINIAGGFLLAGFPSVIGTLWEIEDKRSVEIARSVYSSMCDGDGKLDIRKAARGLHFALRKAREDLLKEKFRNTDPVTWAPYIHVGV